VEHRCIRGLDNHFPRVGRAHTRQSKSCHRIHRVSPYRDPLAKRSAFVWRLERVRLQPAGSRFLYSFRIAVAGVGQSLLDLVECRDIPARRPRLLSSGIYPGIKSRYHGIIYLLLVPLVLGNLDTGQANPTVIGLVLLAVAAVPAERWSVATLCVAAATYLKIYPLAVGLILFLMAPRRFGWRLFLALVLLGILPFLFQHWSYVSQQYHEWISTRSTDDRRLYPIKDVPLDLWFLLVRLGHLPIPGFVYSAFQMLSGGAIALFCLVGVWKAWPKERLLAGILALVCIWMTLCGPATELQTYILLAPAVVLTLIDVLPSSRPLWLRTGLVVVCLLMVLAVARTSLLPSQKGLWILTIQPVAAILFLVCCLVLFLRNSGWKPQVNFR